ncbi:hypothetical protein Calag_1134 [Caldisphaera lagunensis DSM 15908]|uniref:Uncharacterized protein n=1 Tax=Caldisphaera lagunensis (strain DSM 15908 / JCM 11604 / ANMR 0165 / IC-154) TaxID=1056495 RepID=L0AAF5_CALLD|nr:hypothetical protein [Caldisphaera lagunensis]AFZ70856.1 hypothetical protein Calag_1134 [Caldisphaera lagunensis DSM 15908]
MKILFFILILIMISLPIYNLESIPILLNNPSSSIEIKNNSISSFNNGIYSIYYNNIYEGSLVLNGAYKILIYNINTNLLIIFLKNINIKIKNLTFYNSTPYLLLNTNDSNLKILNISIGKYGILNIPGINETYNINGSILEINLNNLIGKTISFSKSSWLIYQFSDNSSLDVVFGIITTNKTIITNPENLSNVTILNSSNIFSENKEDYNKFYMIIYYSLFLLSLLTLVLALVTSNAKWERHR